MTFKFFFNLYRPVPFSLTEREDHRLHHGKEYCNLPANYAELDPCYSIGKERSPNIYASFNDCVGSNSQYSQLNLHRVPEKCFKNVKNTSTDGEVMSKIKLDSFFLGHGVVVYFICSLATFPSCIILVFVFFPHFVAAIINGSTHLQTYG